MDPTFAFVGHPAYLGHLERYLRWASPTQRAINPQLLTKVFEWTPAYVASEVTVRSRTGASRDGLFVVATVMPEMVHLTPQQALSKVVEACVLADRHGTHISSLGGLTSVAGAHAPEVLLGAVKNRVTTGNTLTVAAAVRQILSIAAETGLVLKDLSLTILGGTGDIGSTCAQLLAQHFGKVTLTARNVERLASFAERIKTRYGREVAVTADNQSAVRDADVVIAATSAARSIVDPTDFKPGALVSDVGYPKNIRKLMADRPDILVFLGGLCKLDHPIDFGFDIDLPRPDLLYGCFSEAMVLDFEENYCNFSMGRGNITEDRVAYAYEVGAKHGFVPAPPCQDGEFVGAEAIKSVLRHNPRYA